MPICHGLADRQLLRWFLISCVIGREGDFLHGTPPRALDLREKGRRSCRKRRNFSLRGNDKKETGICRSANPCNLLICSSHLVTACPVSRNKVTARPGARINKLECNGKTVQQPYCASLVAQSCSVSSLQRQERLANMTRSAGWRPKFGGVIIARLLWACCAQLAYPTKKPI